MEPNKTTQSHTHDTRELLQRFLNCYWLRPENEFWMVLRSQVLSQFDWVSPAIDVSCGDGIFSFLHAGGDFDLDFDVFTSVGRLDEVRDEHRDMFDHIDDNYRPIINQRPTYNIAVGTDWKQSLLDKAARLDFYDKLIQHDNNEPLPFADDSFATVYCNSIYWVKDIDTFLRELKRICRPDGRALLEVKLDAVTRYTLAPFADKLGQRWLDIMDRGRAATWPTMADRATWEKRFTEAGLRIAHAIPFVTRTHAHIWDIGLRPIAPMLVRMANQIDRNTRRTIKADWIDLFLDLLEPITREDFELLSGQHEPAELLFVLEPTP